MGFAVAAAIGLLAGVTLDSPQRADAASDLSQATNLLAGIAPWRLVLKVGSQSLFSKKSSIKVTSSDTKICAVAEPSAGVFHLNMNGPGYCRR